MKLKLGSFAEKAPNKVFVAVMLGALAGAAYTLIIPMVLSVLNPDGGDFATVGRDTVVVLSWEVSNYRFAALFALTCAFILFARTASQIILVRVSLDISTDLRQRMYERISAAPIAALESVGLSRLIASITSDVPVIVAGARLLPEMLTSSVTLIGMLGFLLYLNPAAFWFVMGCILFGGLTYQIPVLLGRRELTRARRHVDDLYESIRGLIHGAKELKLNHDKREDYYHNVLNVAEYDMRKASKLGHSIMCVAQNYGNLITFFVIGAVSFVFVNHNAISRQELSGVIMVLLYVTGPVNTLLNFIPQFTAAQIALRKVNDVFSQIPTEDVAHTGDARRDWTTMRFDEVVYRYCERNGEPGFVVGPLSLELRKGEIAFIVGGNGSGKSTLSKLVTLHHRPASGTIAFDGIAVDASNLAGFRRGVAAIYSDYYLFDRALGVGGRDVEQDVATYLKALGLEHKVTFRDGRFSTLALSDGQKRRLALVAAYLEDAELYLFDEWAADQDPTFKAVFYNRILPDLKSRGKAIVAITHDDRFFHLADRLIVMNEGQIVAPDAAGALTELLLSGPLLDSDGPLRRDSPAVPVSIRDAVVQ